LFSQIADCVWHVRSKWVLSRYGFVRKTRQQRRLRLTGRRLAVQPYLAFREDGHVKVFGLTPPISAYPRFDATRHDFGKTDVLLTLFNGIGNGGFQFAVPAY